MKWCNKISQPFANMVYHTDCNYPVLKQCCPQCPPGRSPPNPLTLNRSVHLWIRDPLSRIHHNPCYADPPPFSCALPPSLCNLLFWGTGVPTVISSIHRAGGDEEGSKRKNKNMLRQREKNKEWRRIWSPAHSTESHLLPESSGCTTSMGRDQCSLG